ncbi:uncharacterized protein KY384_000768 [Bacidia gigantensis]|uniref:uncharacterized protein n=1 Tax=Bacidia gigantensis TaxID=2732470 RepID=UPI001D04B87A|nr:uncharacterized protein KY384_000768 [Bacidia gigantensis]KAG8526006.1 hypothetical protein KY384_000768 [Bacidia gigantensis]
MTSKPSLYGLPRPPKSSTTNSASNSAFTSTLSSLLASSTTTKPHPTRPSKPRSKDDIFHTSNRNTKKRALADISQDGLQQTHSTTSQDVDAASWHRSKRKMEEKSRLYASMKRGDYVPTTGHRDKERDGLVDFDRKWAEGPEGDGEGEEGSSDDYATSGDEDAGANGTEEMVEYEDEFGRVRKGTQKEAAKTTRSMNAAKYAGEELAESSALPQRPENLIVGDTVQAAAFNPDEMAQKRMDNLVGKRDRSATPPEEVHYDASSEARSKGVGFYRFSRDGEERKGQMEELGRAREETEKMGREREERRERKKREVEERRKEIARRRGEKMADQFLEGLDVG